MQNLDTNCPAVPAQTDPRLEPIAAKVDAGLRLSLDDGMLLYETPDLWGVLALADRVRRRLHADIAYYNINRHLNYSNVCALSCKFCEFYRKKGDPGAYTHDEASIANEARLAVEAGATEIHIVGGLQPYLPWDYYPTMMRTIKQVAADAGAELHIKAFTAVEIVHMARIAKQYKSASRLDSIRWVLRELKAAGLGSLPGGGAEVFDARLQAEAFKGKIAHDEWLDVHMCAHDEGLNTNATLLYGHIDTRGERVKHLVILRRAQDRALARLGYEGCEDETQRRSGVETDCLPDALKSFDGPVITLTRPGVPLPTVGQASRLSSSKPSGYYQTITPLPFIPDGSALEHLPGPSGLENLRTIAIARLMLDNFPHVKAFWIMQTLPLAQLMLEAGADDIDGTVGWYDITHVPARGADEGSEEDSPRRRGERGEEESGDSEPPAYEAPKTRQQVGVHELRKAIEEAGFTPVERDTLYRRVEREGKA